MLSHSNIQAEAEGAFQLFSDIGEHDALLGILPLFHALSQMASLLLPPIKGAPSRFPGIAEYQRIDARSA